MEQQNKIPNPFPQFNDDDYNNSNFIQNNNTQTPQGFRPNPNMPIYIPPSITNFNPPQQGYMNLSSNIYPS